MAEKHEIIGTGPHPHKKGGDEPNPYLKDGECLPAEEEVRYPASLPLLGNTISSAEKPPEKEGE